MVAVWVVTYSGILTEKSIEFDALDLFFDSGENHEPPTITQTVLIYKHRCAMEKQTALYYDRNHPGIYYFDLEFLD